MYYVDGQHCMLCGTPVRPTAALKINNKVHIGLNANGTVGQTDHWFCSIRCYEKAVGKFVRNDRFGFDKDVYSDPEFQSKETSWELTGSWTPIDILSPNIWNPLKYARRKKELLYEKYDWMNAWEGKQHDVILYALKEFIAHMNEIMDDNTKKQEDRLQKERERLRGQEMREEQQRLRDEERKQERERREQEKAADRASREEYQRKREMERQEEKRQREEEKLKREEEERERARLEEEARIDAMRPRPIPPTARLSHTHVLGATGAGKTTLIIKHVQEDMDADSTVIVIDPKGTLVDRLSRHQHFWVDWNIYDRILDENEEKGITDFDVVGVTPLVLIDPSMFVPALNMFAKPKRKYSPAFAQRMENLTVSLFQYIFASKESSLTDKQLTCFSYSVKLLLSMPRANIRTLLDLLEDPCIPRVGGIRNESYFKPYIDALDDISRRFFYRNFYDASDYTATKDQIATRIHGMLRYPAFADMFLTYENKIDMFDYLRGNKVVLISSPVAVLGTEGSRLFSRYMMSLVLQAALERTTIDRHWWHPAYLYIDEAQLVMDEVKTQELLQLAREFKLGVTLLHHQIEGEISQKIFSTLSANTRIKYASTPAAADARIMAMDMRCEPQFIMDRMPHEHDTHGSFACFCSGVTPHPFIYELDYVEDNSFPELPDDEYRILCQYQKETYGVRKRGPEQEPHSESSRFQTTNEPPGHSPQEEFDTENVSTSKPQPPRQQANTSSIGSTRKIDPHTGDHTEPSEKWGDDQ